MRTRKIETFLIGVGVVLLAIWGGARIHSIYSSRAAMERFDAAKGQESLPSQLPSVDPVSGSPVDFALWSDERTRAYKDSLVTKLDLPLAVLRIPKIRLEVPVFNDTDDLTLNRGVGRILGTARVGATGNLGIAGHRDGFFRGLKDISLGDEIDLLQTKQTDKYVVGNIRVVNPDDVSVLAPTPVPSITLVTCFPFYYIGSAPQRFIVSASMKRPDQSPRDVDPSKSEMRKN
jgi:sortase A